MLTNQTEISSESLIDSVNSFEDARKLFPVTDSCTYLDSAHYSQYSLETRRRLKNFIDEFTFSSKNLSLFNYRIAETVKEKCAELIGADTNDIIITGSTTHGLNIFANGIKLNSGDCVVFADSEFPSVVYAWMNQERLKGIKTEMIPSVNGKILEDDIRNTIAANKAKVLAISSVEFLGFRNDLNSISRICKENDCMLVVDAIQSTGACPVNVRESNIDFFATGGQKWMMSPSGIGFAYINPAIKHLVEPTYVATSSIEYDFKNFLNYKLNFRKDGAAYENSTPNTLGLIGMESSIELFLKLGVDNIFKHILGLQDLFMSEMEDSDFVIDSDLTPEHRSNILIFSYKEGSQNEAVQKYLENENIFVALREGFLRLAAHLFNNEDDILKLCIALKKFKGQ